MTGAVLPPEARPASLWRRLWRTPMSDVLRGRLTCSLDHKAVVDAAGLPDSVGQLVQRVVRRTHLWRSEKVDVARELAAHFQDGLAAGASADELVESFGDTARAARLIRRAKRRGRSPVWKTWALGTRSLGALFCLALAVYVVQAVRMFTQGPNITRNYVAEWNAAPAAVPEEERAWPVYRRGAVLLGDLPEGVKLRYRPGQEGWTELLAFASEREEASRLYRQAGSMGELGALLGDPADEALYSKNGAAGAGNAIVSGDDNPIFMSVLLPQLTVLRDGARLLALDTHLAIADGDAERVGADIAAMFGITEHAYQVRFLIGDLVALAVHRLTCELVGTVLRDHPGFLSDAQLVEVSHRLAAAGGEGLSISLQSEYAAFDDMTQRCYTDGGLPLPQLLSGFMDMGDPGNYESSFPLKLIAPAASVVLAGRQATLDRHRSLMTQIEAAAAVPLWERERSRVEREIEHLASSPVLRLRYLPLWIYMPSLERAHLHAEYAVQVRDATLAAIALELHRRRHGTWPATLAELTPRLLPTVPLDRYDGQALKYRVVDGRPILYSIGVDRDDDGGRLVAGESSIRRAREWRSLDEVCDPNARPPVADGDWVLWPPVGRE